MVPAFLGAYFGHSSGSSRPKSTPRRHSAEVGLAHRRRVEGQHFVETALSSAKSSPGVPHARGHPQSTQGYKWTTVSPVHLFTSIANRIPASLALPSAVTPTTIPVRSWWMTTIPTHSGRRRVRQQNAVSSAKGCSANLMGLHSTSSPPDQGRPSYSTPYHEADQNRQLLSNYLGGRCVE